MKLSEELVSGLYKEICQRRDCLLLTLGFICFFFLVIIFLFLVHIVIVNC